MTPDPNESIEPPTWLSVQEIAERLRISKMSVHRLVNSGTLPAYRFGRTLRIDFSDFQAYVGRSQVAVDRSAQGKIEA